ncbi:STAS domain-containing protein [Candidatus Sumerlaeota bacterium]|nr:STAS domain-containing protein [Candidatus Sumerlaeota bacterium]
MEIKFERLRDIQVVTLKGSLDSENVSELKKIFDDFLQASRSRIVVDLEEVDSIDSSVLAVFVTRSHDFDKRGGGLYLAGVKDSIRDILDSFSLTPFFRIFTDVNEACKSV